MTVITNFKKIRKDGKVIDESMTAAQIISLGWGPEKVVEISWKVAGKQLNNKGKCGLLAVVVPNRIAIALLKENDDSGLNSSLVILDANGDEIIEVKNQVFVNGKKEVGDFCWFEPTRNSSSDCFGIAFRLGKNQSMVQVDIDSNTGDITGMYPMK